MDTLSVSISNRLSPGLTTSPTDLNQVVILPSATVSPSCGIRISIPTPPQAPASSLQDATEPDDALGISARPSRQANICDQPLRHVRTIAVAKESGIAHTPSKRFSESYLRYSFPLLACTI